MELSEIPNLILNKLTRIDRFIKWQDALAVLADSEQVWLESNKIKHNTVLKVRFSRMSGQHITTSLMYAYLKQSANRIYIVLFYFDGYMCGRYPLMHILSSIEIVDSLDIIGVDL